LPRAVLCHSIDFYHTYAAFQIGGVLLTATEGKAVIFITECGIIVAFC